MDTSFTWKCSTAGGPGPAAHTGGEGAEGSGEHGPGGEGGNESAGVGSEEGDDANAFAPDETYDNESARVGSEEGDDANALAPDETYDAVRSGARLILNYDAPSNSFKGTVENTTNGVLDRVRIEVHLSNGAELGPTTPTDMVPGEVVAINLPATPASFTGWTVHAEVGAGGEGSESGEEHRDGGENGGGRESGGEHGSSGERRGGG